MLGGSELTRRPVQSGICHARRFRPTALDAGPYRFENGRCPLANAGYQQPHHDDPHEKTAGYNHHGLGSRGVYDTDSGLHVWVLDRVRDVSRSGRTCGSSDDGGDTSTHVFMYCLSCRHDDTASAGSEPCLVYVSRRRPHQHEYSYRRVIYLASILPIVVVKGGLLLHEHWLAYYYNIVVVASSDPRSNSRLPLI